MARTVFGNRQNLNLEWVTRERMNNEQAARVSRGLLGRNHVIIDKLGMMLNWKLGPQCHEFPENNEPYHVILVTRKLNTNLVNMRPGYAIRKKYNQYFCFLLLKGFCRKGEVHSKGPGRCKGKFLL
jgi:hypothetical protein